MRRREFLTAAGVAAGSGGLASGGEKQGVTGRVKMYVGCQRGPTTETMLQFHKRHGVDHICGFPVIGEGRGYWTVEELARTKDLCEKEGVTLDMVALPFLTSSHIDREKRGAIMLGKSPERDRDIEEIQKMIAACGTVGVSAFKYNMSLLGVIRTASTPGRGGSVYSTWRAKEAKADPAVTRAGRVTAEMAWERITYFLERVIPVCNEYKVRAACHPHDPGTPAEGYQGVYNVLGTVEGLKKFVSIQESPYHGLNFCLGTIAENLEDPARELFDVVRYFGERKKIFNVHFRNIRGKRGSFQEVYHDEGDLNMPALARALHEVGYDRMVMPDHVPHHHDDEGSLQAFAFAYGYIKGILQSMG